MDKQIVIGLNTTIFIRQQSMCLIVIGLNTTIFIRQESMCLIVTTSIRFLKLLNSLKIPKLGRNMFFNSAHRPYCLIPIAMLRLILMYLLIKILESKLQKAGVGRKRRDT